MGKAPNSDTLLPASLIETARQILLEIIQNAPIALAICRCPDFVFEVINPPYQALAPGKTILGRRFAEVWPELAGTQVELLQRVSKTGEPYNAQNHPFNIQRSPGGPFESIFATFSVLPLPGLNQKIESLLILVVETTAAFRQRQQLDETVARNEAIIASMIDGLLIADRQGDVLFVNPAGLKFHRWENEREALRNVREFSEFAFYDLEDHLLPAEEWPLARILHGETIRNLELQVARTDTGEKWFARYSGTPVWNVAGEFSLIVLSFRDISVRKRAEAALREKHAILHTILDSTSDFIFMKDLNCHYVVINRAAAAAVGKSVEEILGCDDYAIFPPEIAGKIMEKDRSLMAEGGSRQFEECLPLAGEERHLLLATSTCRDAGNKVVGVVGIGRDITGRVKAEAAVRQSEEHLRLALDAAQSGAWEWDLRGGENIWSEELWRLYDLEPQSCQPSYESWLKVVHPDDRQKVEQTVQTAASAGTELSFEFRVATRDGAERWLMSRARPLRNLQGGVERYIGIVVDITARKRAEMELAESEEKYRTLYETMAQGVISHDAEGRVIFANSAAEKILGISRERMKGHTFRGRGWNVIREDGSGLAIEEHPFMMALSSGKPCALVTGVWNSQRNQYRWIHVHAVPRFRPGQEKPFQVFTTFEDITELKEAQAALLAAHDKLEERVRQRTQELTWMNEQLAEQIEERKRAEKELQQKEKSLSTAQRIAHLGSWFRDYQTGRGDWSEELYQIYGISRDDIEPSRQSWLNLIPADDRVKVEQVLQQAIANHEMNFGVEYRVLRPDGSIRYVQSRGELLFDDSGKALQVTGTVHDVTESKRAEEELQRKEGILSAAQRIAHLGSWYRDLESGKIDWSEELFRIYGVSPQEVTPSREAWMNLIHPDDRLKVEQTIGQAVVNHAKNFSVEYRVVRPDGSIRFVHSRGEIQAGADGQAHKVMGTVHDVTERKQAELEIRQAYNEIEHLKDILQAENVYLRQEIQNQQYMDEIVGESHALKHVLYRIEQVAPTDTTVLVLGETGTGKGRMAQLIHNLSRRKNHPLVKVNCAALPAGLIESELFGREKGAYTGAHARQLGRFEVAHGGTIFLDEIGELPLELQAKLLRVIQDGEFERLGSAQTIKVDVRLIASTNRNLVEAIRKGKFREDLYYRLHVFPITLPPLCQRADDIPALVNYLVGKFSKKMAKDIRIVPVAAMKKLQEYPWPGNIRELENVIERAIINSPGPVLLLADKLDAATAENLSPAPQKSLEDMEREHIIKALNDTNWRISGPKGAAKILGINASTLRSRMQKLGIEKTILKVAP